VSGSINIKIGDEELNIDPKTVSDITISVAYWRKANQIHKYLTTNNGVDIICDDDIRSEVKGAALIRLVEICKKLKKHLEETGKDKNGNYKDTSLCEELLPTQDGFFFGSTQYNDDYVYDLEMTIEQLDGKIKADEWYKYLASY
jgi:hypothetical protein